MEELEDMFDVDLSRKRFLIYAIDRDVMSSSHIEFVSCNWASLFWVVEFCQNQFVMCFMGQDEKLECKDLILKLQINYTVC